MKQWAEKIYYGGDYNPDQWDEATVDAVSFTHLKLPADFRVVEFVGLGW